MSDLEWLYLILALLYVWECFCWLPRGGVALKTGLGRRWRLAHPGSSLGNQKGGFVLAQPLPPMGTFLTATQFPLSVSPEGLLVYVATNANPGWRPAQSGNYVAFADMREVRVVNKQVLVNGEVFLKCPFPHNARAVASVIDRLAQLPPGKRGAALEEFGRHRFDLDTAKQQIADHQKRSRALHWAVNILFVYLFIAIPAVITRLGFKRTWLELLLGLLVLTVGIGVLFWRAHRALYPGEEEDRFTHSLTAALSPAAATRAHDTLSRPLLHAFHPLVPAKLLLTDGDFADYAGRVLRDARYPMLPVCPDDRTECRAAEQQARDRLLRSLEAFIQRAGLSPEELCRPPKPADDSCRSYCPRCQSQFTTLDGTCADCGGRALVAFPAQFSTPAGQASR